jgi:hypothetical protein
VLGGVGLGPVRAPLVVLQKRLQSPHVTNLRDLLFLAIDDDFIVLRCGNRLLGLLQSKSQRSAEKAGTGLSGKGSPTYLHYNALMELPEDTQAHCTRHTGCVVDSNSSISDERKLARPDPSVFALSRLAGAGRIAAVPGPGLAIFHLTAAFALISYSGMTARR